MRRSGYLLDAGCHNLGSLLVPGSWTLLGPWLASQWAGQLSLASSRIATAKPSSARQPASSEYPTSGYAKYARLTVWRIVGGHWVVVLGANFCAFERGL